MEEEHDARENQGRKSVSKRGTNQVDTDSKRNGSQGDMSGKDSQEGIDFKYDIPNTCKLEMLELNRIERFEEDYQLVVHPFPQMDGELILFQTNANDQEDKNIIVYKDYSLRKRIETPVK